MPHVAPEHRWRVLALLTFVGTCLLTVDTARGEGLPTDLGSAWQSNGTFNEPPSTGSIPAAEQDRLQRSIEEALRDSRISGHSISARIVDSHTGETVFERNPDQWLKPASNTKVFTTAAALDLLGRDTEPSSRVFATGPVHDGVLDGDLVLVGDHDMTWSFDFYPSEEFVADRLVKQLEVAGITDVRGDLVVQGLFVVGGQRFGTFGQHAYLLDAAERFRKTLSDREIRIYGETQVKDTFELPAERELLASWSAVPLSVVVSYINRLSHNEYADALLRWIGYETTGTSSYEAGFVAVRQWAESHDIPSEALVLYDGSGLSHDNRISANALVAVHQHMLSGPLADLWRSSLSAAGVYGTYALRMDGENTVGRAFCKSGTIDGVITGSGILRNRFDNHDYIFALMMNDIRNQPAARLVQDEIVNALAENLRGTEPRPSGPELHSVLPSRDQIVVTFDPVADSERCDLWARGLRDDGWSWVTGVDAAKTSLRVQPPNTLPTSYRMTCSNAGGTSEPSDAYVASRPGMSQGRRTLLVDGNDRWQEEPAEENELHTGHEFLTTYAEPLSGDAVGSVHHEHLPEIEVAVRDFDLAVWAWGEQGADWSVCSPSHQQWFEDFAAAGGSLFVSGSEAAWHICSNEEGGESFLNSTFAADFVSDDAGTRVARASTDEGSEVLYFLDPHGMFVGYPDALSPLSGATSCGFYLGGSEATACVLQSGTGGHTVFVGFPVESIVQSEARARWLEWLFAQLDN